MSPRTVVIGGGVAGLATAALLAHEGHDVTLLERHDRVGGRAGTRERAGFRFDTGPSWYLMPQAFEHFFNLLGTSAAEQLDLRTLDPGYRVYHAPDATGGVRELTIPHGAARVAETFEAREAGSARRLAAYLRSARHANGLAERTFLYNPFTRLARMFTPEVLRAVPRLAGQLGGSLQRFIARRFSDPVLRQVLGYPAVFLGTDPRRAPAIYHLMSTLDLDDGVQYPIGGFWEVAGRLEALARDSGVQIVLGAEATEIMTDRSGRRATVTGVRWHDRGGTESVAEADIVVSAADLHHTETQLLPAPLRTFPESWWQKRESGPGGIIAMLGIEGSLPQLEHHTLFFTDDWDENFDRIFGPDARVPDPASIYVCKPSATDDAVAPDGSENLFVLIPVPADPRLGAGGRDGAGDAAIERAVDAALEQMASWARIPNLRSRIVVRETLGPADFVNDYSSWSGGMLGPSHILSQSALFRAQNQSKKVDGLYYAGGTTAPGVGVPMCLISAEVVLKRIRGDHSPGPTSPRPARRAHQAPSQAPTRESR